MTPRTNNGNPSQSVSIRNPHELIDALVEWFHHNQRQLEFRQTRNPYAIMVSEFMLQQTTVAAVLPFYTRFLKRFPSITDLAEATEDEVLAYWAGLGYYRRARQLREAARRIVSDFEGEFPNDPDILQTLPGFGRYTAGAVSSFAYDVPAPILEANTLRVFSRITALDGMIGDTAFMKKLWEVADALVKISPSPGEFNVAAMELGALICKPDPDCSICPIQNHCLIFRIGNPASIPKPRPRPEKVSLTRITAIIKNHAGEFFLRKISQGEWHAGMWEFPTFATDVPTPVSSDISVAVKDNLGLACNAWISLFNVKYTVTHHSITTYVFACDHFDRYGSSDKGQFFSIKAISELALGSAQRKIFNRIAQTKNQELSL